jgi:hypothetical protein
MGQLNVGSNRGSGPLFHPNPGTNPADEGGPCTDDKGPKKPDRLSLNLETHFVDTDADRVAEVKFAQDLAQANTLLDQFAASNPTKVQGLTEKLQQIANEYTRLSPAAKGRQQTANLQVLSRANDASFAFHAGLAGMTVSFVPRHKAPLSPEEKSLMARGLLPACYAELKGAQIEPTQIKANIVGVGGGPYDPDYFNTSKMLQTARNVAANPDLEKMFHDMKPGDIVLEAPHDAELVSKVTQGPYSHVLICTSTNPMPQFIEAIGITAQAGDHTANQVRRTSFSSQFDDKLAYRVIRPVPYLNAPEVRKAIAFAERQLGKPYNYTFESKDLLQGKEPSSYYCSELGYAAYKLGAGIDLHIQKADRDSLMLQVDKALDELGPKNRDLLKARLSDFINQGDMSPKATARFIVDKILPECQVTEHLVDRVNRVPLTAAIAEMLDAGAGVGSKHLTTKIGKGAEGVLGFSMLSIVMTLDGARTGIKAIKPLTNAFKDIKPVLAQVNGQAAPAPTPAGTTAQKNEFISPTDLAYAKVPGKDYNPAPTRDGGNVVAKNQSKSGFTTT